ncbi:tol-pal system protein YbgF [Myxococcota bacterium]|nr:tol-pal system protein YbgF [Myxococcota bacterium]
MAKTEQTPGVPGRPQGFLRGSHFLGVPILLVVVMSLSGCVTPAEFEKLRVKVVKLERGGTVKPGSPEAQQRLAELGADLERISKEIKQLSGRVEVAEHQAGVALKEAQTARTQVARLAVSGVEPAESEGPPPVEGEDSEEVARYRAAYEAWRKDDYQVCIDRFRAFLQNYEQSPYADDAAYWLADCYFKRGDFKTSVLRFDDVVARYPTGNKAADALYRQGEALLRLGPNYSKAAGKAFERVVREYPDSARVPEARRQLELLGSQG